ncbi:PIN domain-containing protein [Haladaptatus sp. GCM10025707]|uniref:PIN domain-containing protein n=1 Tax=unclassified Haladaptatus TaxID=2622732 RepID=UPI0023E7A83F|nr:MULTISPECIES: PIN domain-containing protein [unclassified Haladaptatus]
MASQTEFAVLETSFLVDFLNGDEYTLKALEFLREEVAEFVVPAITMYELYSGAIRSNAADDSPAAVDHALSWASVRPFDADQALTAARIRAQLLDDGNPIPVPDILIAAAAEVTDHTVLVTTDHHFTALDSPTVRVYNPTAE